ncbi:MAG: hypothetical protein ACTTJW_03025 [Sphaerochaeta sp.]
MSSRYYFLSSLPMLRYSEPAPISWEYFLKAAEGNIDGSEYRLLCGIPKNKDCGNGFLKNWNALNAELNASINSRRNRNLGKPSENFAVFSFFDTERLTNAAMDANNPLDAEMLLLKFRYDYLETAKGYEPFTKTALLVYALQLRILIRKDSFTSKAGNHEFQKLFGILRKEITTD